MWIFFLRKELQGSVINGFCLFVFMLERLNKQTKTNKQIDKNTKNEIKNSIGDAHTPHPGETIYDTMTMTKNYVAVKFIN